MPCFWTRKLYYNDFAGAWCPRLALPRHRCCSGQRFGFFRTISPSIHPSSANSSASSFGTQVDPISRDHGLSTGELVFRGSARHHNKWIPVKRSQNLVLDVLLLFPNCRVGHFLHGNLEEVLLLTDDLLLLRVEYGEHRSSDRLSIRLTADTFQSLDTFLYYFTGKRTTSLFLQSFTILRFIHRDSDLGYHFCEDCLLLVLVALLMGIHDLFDTHLDPVLSFLPIHVHCYGIGFPKF